MLQKAPRITDPSPIHLTVDTDTDDLSDAEHFSLISFEKSMRGNPNLSSISDSNFGESNHHNSSRRNSDGQNRHRQHRRSHRRVHSWDSSTGVDLNTAAAAAAGIGTKSCLAVPKVLRRQQRVMVADVASVGNASDTLVSIVETNNGKGRGRITGRELHETAKASMNEGDYQQALHMFEAILRAQLDRFGSEEHSSVGAALHNVGVVRLRIGEPRKAEEAFLRALAIRRSVLGTEHLDLAVSMTCSDWKMIILYWHIIAFVVQHLIACFVFYYLDEYESNPDFLLCYNIYDTGNFGKARFRENGARKI